MLGVALMWTWAGYALAFYGFQQIRGENNGFAMLAFPWVRWSPQANDSGGSGSGNLSATQAGGTNAQNALGSVLPGLGTPGSVSAPASTSVLQGGNPFTQVPGSGIGSGGRKQAVCPASRPYWNPINNTCQSNPTPGTIKVA